MDEVNTKGLSISFRVDDGVIEHNNRKIIAKNVDPARTSDNITYTQIELKQFYEQIFGEALAEYNARQTRSDRRINDYYEHIKKSGKGKLFYEIVVQFGDLHDCVSALKSGKRRKLCLTSICWILKNAIQI